MPPRRWLLRFRCKVRHNQDWVPKCNRKWPVRPSKLFCPWCLWMSSCMPWWFGAFPYAWNESLRIRQRWRDRLPSPWSDRLADLPQDCSTFLCRPVLRIPSRCTTLWCSYRWHLPSSRILSASFGSKDSVLRIWMLWCCGTRHVSFHIAWHWKRQVWLVPRSKPECKESQNDTTHCML